MGAGVEPIETRGNWTLPSKSWQDQITIGTKDQEPTWNPGEAGGVGDAQEVARGGTADSGVSGGKN
jgi:hypothetical protein